MYKEPNCFSLIVGPTDLLDAAIYYASLGLRIFPCKPGGKTPLINKWPERATTDPEIIRAWWAQWPDANIAIVTGGNLGVLDVDPDHGGFDSIKSLLRLLKIPSIAISNTGTGGIHYYIPNDLGIRSKVGMKPGLDWRGQGGYVIAPPSIHPNGEVYIWHTEPKILT